MLIDSLFDILDPLFLKLHEFLDLPESELRHVASLLELNSLITPFVL